MKLNEFLTRRTFGSSSLAALAAAFLLGSVQPANAQYRFIPEHRRPIDATIHDLQEVAARNPHAPRDQRRYNMALRHLGDFAGRLQQGFWDNRRLDQAIGDVRNVVDSVPMDPRGRDMLHRDVEELRHLRDRHDGRYRYPY